MKVLLIDDDEALLTIFSKALLREGIKTVLSLTGADGLEKAQSEAFDLILLDQVLPDATGNEVLAKLKADDKTKDIPVLILSNFSQEELVKEAMNEGATEYILKYQVAPHDLVNKVKQYAAKN